MEAFRGWHQVRTMLNTIENFIDALVTYKDIPRVYFTYKSVVL